MTRLKVAIIAPPWFTVPPLGYGGIEWVVSLLADGLVERGHDVTLFASGGSTTSARLVSTYQDPPSARLGEWTVEAPAVLDAYNRWHEFDVIHDHTLLGPMTGAFIDVPVVHTVHGHLSPEASEIYRRIGNKVHLVAISESQRSTLPPGINASVIYNGIDVDRFPYGGTPDDYLLFVGRMTVEKGILSALEIAKRTDKRLIILGKVNEAPERHFFETEVKPRLKECNAEYLDQPTHEVKAGLYANAFATLFPIAWPEPFGLVMVESMAAGTPVIAFRAGSVPEVVADGKTGFICDGVDDAVKAVSRIPEISRAECREHVQRYFSAEANVTRHEELYCALTSSRVPGHAIAAAAAAQTSA